METRIEGNNLVISIPLCDPKPSSTGNTLIVASTGGPIRTACMVNGSPVTIGMNAFIPNPARVKKA